MRVWWIYVQYKYSHKPILAILVSLAVLDLFWLVLIFSQLHSKPPLSLLQLIIYLQLVALVPEPIFLTLEFVLDLFWLAVLLYLNPRSSVLLLPMILHLYSLTLALEQISVILEFVLFAFFVVFLIVHPNIVHIDHPNTKRA